MTDQEIYEVADNYFNIHEFTIYAAAEHNSVDITPDLFAFARALLSRAIPEGHVVVPKEPTPEMCAAGYYTHGTPCAPDVIYRAMIAAVAPEASK